MLAVNSRKYRIPVKSKDVEGNTVWRLYPNNESNHDYITAYTFNYTWVDHLFHGKFRATFNYEGDHVKPSPRTLRVYGANALNDVVLKLATNTNYDSDIDWNSIFEDDSLASKQLEELMSQPPSSW